ncbi:MAG: GWxTD domain-containing protein [Bacteroidales bacterium]
MKKIWIILGLSLLSLNIQALGKTLSASLNFATFYSPVDGTFVETYLSVAGQSVNYVRTDNGTFQATVEVLMIFRQDDKIATFRKYELKSPEITDTSFVTFSFLDIQRIPLSIGKYTFEIKISDLNNAGKSFKGEIPLEIYFDHDTVVVSGIQLVESYSKTEQETALSKHGYDLVPRVSTFFPQETNRLIAYYEIYNTDKVMGSGQKFLSIVYISNHESGYRLPQFSRAKRMEAQPVLVQFNEFDISKLPSGNYDLTVEIRDRENRLLALNTLFFQRSNPGFVPDFLSFDSLETKSSFASRIKNADSLRQVIKSFRPIAADYEKIFIDQGLKTAPIEVMQAYIYSFWKNRSDSDPETAFNRYMEQVRKVQALFGTRYLKGYDTDRGRIYLQYGPPDAINENPYDAGAISTLSDNEINRGVGGSVPYQIWQYYQIKNQRNRFFVFYNPHLVPGGYVLLHSDVQGELYNPMWQSELKRKPIEDIDAGNPLSNPNQ